MATTTEDRLHIEQDFTRYSKIASRLLGEDGALLSSASDAESPSDYQPSLGTTGGSRDGAIRLIECIGLRPGSTIQGFNSTVRVLSEKCYGIHSPAPIILTGWYTVRASQLPDEFSRVLSEKVYGIHSPALIILSGWYSES